MDYVYIKFLHQQMFYNTYNPQPFLHKCETNLSIIILLLIPQVMKNLDIHKEIIFA